MAGAAQVNDAQAAADASRMKYDGVNAIVAPRPKTSSRLCAENLDNHLARQVLTTRKTWLRATLLLASEALELDFLTAGTILLPPLVAHVATGASPGLVGGCVRSAK